MRNKIVSIWTEELGRIYIHDPILIEKCKTLNMKKLQAIFFQAVFRPKAPSSDYFWSVTEISIGDLAVEPRCLSSVRLRVEAVIEKIMHDKGYGYMRTKKYGEAVFFKYTDYENHFNELQVGNDVLAWIVVQEVDNSYWRSLFFIKDF